ncbi:SH3-like domain-containing protein [Synechocystis sp. LKSZ1]|uniref:SH3-like domain-containing protein n=1 Tax=Synechocystis sp. LKSZ1 TaxID=3144951 RepID=UPI00336BD924
MSVADSAHASSGLRAVKALCEESDFKVGDRVRIAMRFPIGHYRVPTYVRGKQGVVKMILNPMAINNEEEGYGRNAGIKGRYYRVGILLSELWPGYTGPPQDQLVIEVFETWLERI